MDNQDVAATVGDLDLEALGDRIARTAAGIDSATHKLLADVRTFDAHEGWAAQGATSCAHWLGWKCGIAPGAAREKVRVARALATLPLVDEQFRLGRLSYSKVRAMTRVATPENEANLVSIACASTAAQLEKICRLVDQVRPRDSGADETRRWFRSRPTDDGMVRIEAQLRPEEAARVLAACDSLRETGSGRVDALLAMAEATLRGDRPERPAIEAIVHIDAACLSGETDGTGVSAETSRRLLCDAGVVPVIEDSAGTPLDVGRKRRLFSGALRRALLARDRGCRFPGCSHTRFLHAHHVRHWIDGGTTCLDNALMLCSRHHALVHEGGFRIVFDGAAVRFLQPNGAEVVGGRPAANPVAVPVVRDLPPTWRGDAVDYHLAVECLL
jgi:hypothetical protein